MPVRAATAEIRPPRTERELTAAFELRRAVFCGEQRVPGALEADGRDGEALHLVALAGESVIGTCRLLVAADVARLGRLAVAPAHRNRGVGRALLQAAQRQARAAGARRISLHAQLHARELYVAEGFGERGRPFREAGIEHVTMDKRLA